MSLTDFIIDHFWIIPLTIIIILTITLYLIMNSILDTGLKNIIMTIWNGK